MTRSATLAAFAALALGACSFPSKQCWADLEAAERAGTRQALESFLREYPYYPYSANIQSEIQRIKNRDLLEALQSGDYGRTRTLLDEGAGADGGNGVAWGAPLRAAALRGDTRSCRRLLQYGAQIEATDALENTVLAVTARAGLAEVARFLIERGAQVNAAGEMGQTPLHFAAGAGSDATFAVLLAAGADPEKRDAFGLRPRELQKARELAQLLRPWLDHLGEHAGTAEAPDTSALRSAFASADPASASSALVGALLHDEPHRPELLRFGAELHLSAVSNALALALAKHGSRPMAEDYLGSPSPALADAARGWIVAHGYPVPVASR